MDLKRRDFFRFWSLIEVGIIACSWTAVGISIARYQQVKRLDQLFEQPQSYVHLNRQVAIYLNDLWSFLLTFCCFFDTLKCLRQYNEREFSSCSRTDRSASRINLRFDLEEILLMERSVPVYSLPDLSKLTVEETARRTATRNQSTLS